MNITSSLVIIALAALVHASFQLSVSVLTLLSGHAIGLKKSHKHLLSMTTSFVFGAGVMTMLLLSFAVLIIMDVFGHDTPQAVWAIGCGITFGVAISIWLFYYRREKGTALWIPRGVADYLTERTKSTKITAESFSLGMTSVIGELLFIIAPLVISGLVIAQLSPIGQMVGIGIYTVISTLSLLVVWALIGGGHSLAKIQKWRETNKHFLQFAAGAGLIIIAFFVYVNEIVSTTVIGGI